MLEKDIPEMRGLGVEGHHLGCNTDLVLNQFQLNILP